MKNGLIVITLLLAGLAIRVDAVDYGVDLSFDPGTFGNAFPSCGDPVSTIYKQPDGKLIVGGSFRSHNGQTANFLVRLNTDGSRDMTFQSVLSPATQVTQDCVERIRPLADGKLMVIGSFKVAGQDANYVKLNADGSLDPSMPNRDDTGRDVLQMPDGKFIVCGQRDINSEVYWVAHRLNADGSVDPSWRINYAQGFCNRVELVDGNLMMVGSFFNGSGPFHRFNTSGVHDDSFQVQYVGASPGSGNFAMYPDGRVLIAYTSMAGRFVHRVSSSGQLELNYVNCHGEALLPEADGSAFISDCQKFSGGSNFPFADVRADGKVVPDMDWISFQGSPRFIQGIVDAGAGKYYVHGSFTGIDGVNRPVLARLMPRGPAPVKAKFDFDGDGKSDYAVWRPSDRVWYVYQSTAGPSYVQWGLSTDIPVATDYNGDGTTDIGIFRDGLWYLYTPTGLQFRFFGQAGDRPLVGAMVSRNDESLLVRRVQGETVSWWGEAGNNQTGWSIGNVEPSERPTDIPVIGDFDGDGREEMGYFRNGTWVTRDWQGVSTVALFQWGAAGDVPVPDDYDGDGQDDYAVFRPSTGVWWINRSTEGWLIVKWGIGTDVPVPADYDGDGKVDIAIYRDGLWWQLLSSNGSVLVVSWGVAGDIPIPAQHR